MDKIVEPFYILLAILKRFKNNQPAATEHSEGEQGNGENYWESVAGQRLSRRRALVAAGATSLGAAFLAACGGGSSESGAKKEDQSNKLITQVADTYKQAKKGGTLKLNHFQDVQGLDPGFANLPNETVKIFTYSWLMAYESGYMGPSENKVIGDIGESWEFSPDGLTMTVKVRQGVKWHNKAPVNGRALDVDDVVFSYDRLAAKGAPKGDIVNAANPNAPVLSFKATDKNTIVVKLKEPTSYITAIFAYATGVMPMLPKETDTTFDIRGDQIGTGPFVLEKYQPSVAFTYKRNQEYFRKDYPICRPGRRADRLRVRGAPGAAQGRQHPRPVRPVPRPRRGHPADQEGRPGPANLRGRRRVHVAASPRLAGKRSSGRTSACARPTRCRSTVMASSTRATT